MGFNLFTDPLEGLDFEAFVNVLEVLKDEGQRIEFKSELDTARERELAEDACSLANAYGGIIIVGVQDPKKTGGSISFAQQAPEDSDDYRLRLSNRILTLTYPPLPAEIVTVREANMPHRNAVVIRIRQSAVAPHEYIPTHSFVVRRGARKAALSLPEIEGLLRRRDFGPESPQNARDYANVQFGPAYSDTFGDHVGVTIRPRDRIRTYTDFGTADEERIREVVRTLRKQHFVYQPLEDGLVGGDVYTDDRHHISAAGFAFEVCADGTINVRMELGWRKGLKSDAEDVALILLFGVALSERMYYSWQYSPHAVGYVALANRTHRNRPVNVMPDVYNGIFEVELRTADTAVSIARVVERMWRSSGSNPQRDAVVRTVTAVKDKSFR